MKFIRDALTILVVAVLAIVAGVSVQSVLGVKASVLRLIASIPTPSADQVNRAVVRLLSEGRASELYAFYAQDAGSPAEAAFYTTGALSSKWRVSKAMAFAWWARKYGVMGRQSPGEMETVGSTAVVDDRAISMAEYVRAEHNSQAKTEGDMNAPVRPEALALILLHEQDMNRRFAVLFGDALDW